MAKQITLSEREAITARCALDMAIRRYEETTEPEGLVHTEHGRMGELKARLERTAGPREEERTKLDAFLEKYGSRGFDLVIDEVLIFGEEGKRVPPGLLAQARKMSSELAAALDEFVLGAT